MKRIARLAAATTVLFLALIVPAPGQGTSGAEKLHARYEAELAVAEAPLAELDARYVEELGKLRDAEQEKGALDEVLKINKEIKSHAEAGERNFANGSALAKLRAVYENARSKRRVDVRKAQTQVLVSFIEQAEELKTALTQSGEIEAAVAVDKFAKRLAERSGGTNDLLSPSELKVDAPDVLWTLRGKNFSLVKGCTAERKAGALLLTSAQTAMSFLASEDSFAPPVRAKYRAATNQLELRLYFADKQIAIFNWATDIKQLRMQDPVTLQHHAIQGKGYVREGELHDFEVVVTPTKIQVFADGELRGDMSGDYSKLNGPFGIGPALGSEVTLEAFHVQ